MRVPGEWFILRTSGPSTLALAASLTKAGIEAWTPQMVAKRRRPRSKIVVERDAAILPTFVFVHRRYIDDVAVLSRQLVSPHPDFSIFARGNRVPFIGGLTLQGLRLEEASAAAALQAERDAAALEAERQERAALLRTEKMRRKALRSEHREFAAGAAVEVQNAPAFAGMTGTIVSSNGTDAIVSFGGKTVWKIEAWQLLTSAVDDRATAAG